jgi:hypothetical protein
MKVSNYGIVKEMTMEGLIKAVNENIKLDIHPIGGLVLNTTYHGTEYMQAMVKFPPVGRPKKETE